MSRDLSSDRLLREMAEEACETISRKVIRSLQSMTDARLSGDDSCLANAWDEICVQIQGEESSPWPAYEATLEQFLSTEVEALPAYKLEAIWLQTLNGVEWDVQDEDSRAESPVILDDVVEYIQTQYIYSKAADWTNRRIRDYMEQR